MATKKKPTKTSAKKSSTKPKTEAAKTAKSEKPETVASAVEATPKMGKEIFKGFFAKKCDPKENVLTIFKNPKIYAALIGELVGTMLLSMLFLTLGVQPLYMIFGCIGITLAVFTLSGANLNYCRHDGISPYVSNPRCIIYLGTNRRCVARYANY